jgi:hypothetical protein
MSEIDQIARNDAALGKVVRLGYDFEHAKSALEDVAKQMEQTAQLLRDGRRDIEPFWLDKTYLLKLWEDVDRAGNELVEAESAASALGVAIPMRH